MTFYHIYTDESRQDGHRYMLYGLLFVPRGEGEQALRDDFIRLRHSHQWGTGEFKWEKVSNGKLHVYQEVIDLFFAHPRVEFRCLVVDKAHINYETDYQRDRETAFYDFYFQALSRNLSVGHDYWVYADDRNNRQSNQWEDLRAKVNEHWAVSGVPRSLVRVLEPRRSKEEDLLQIVDVMLGAVGYDIEERAESPAKVAIVRHIEQKIGSRPLREHRGQKTRFCIERFDFRNRIGGG